MTRSRGPLPRPVPVRLSRRGFLTGTVAAGTAGAALAGCSTDELGGVAGPGSSSTTTVARARQFFSLMEARAVEAATARILPGDEQDPGAREAGVVVYIDALLASGGWGSEPVYRMGPFVSPDDAEASGDGADDEQGSGDSGDGGEPTELGTSSFGVTRRPIGSFDRYGEQSIMSPNEAYRLGLAAMEAHAVERFNSPFIELAPDEQDEVLADMERGEATTFDEPSGQDFFALLRQHTIEGMFSDPMYGGNRDMVGWRLVGWPGAQRSYSPRELLAEDEPRPPQAMDHLPEFQPGRRGSREEPVLPLAGSDRHDHDEAGR